MADKKTPHPHDFPEGKTEGTRTINVLKPFILSLPGNDRTGENLVNLIPKETKFEIGEQDVGEHVWSHPFIWRDYADGHIESPDQALERHKAAVEKAEREKLDAAQQIERANAALARSRPMIGMTEELEKELNTPVTALRANGGKAGDSGSGVTQTGLPHDPESIPVTGQLDAETTEETEPAHGSPNPSTGDVPPPPPPPPPPLDTSDDSTATEQKSGKSGRGRK